MVKNITLKIICLFVIVILCFMMTASYAASNSDLNDINDKIDQAEEDLGEVQADKSEAMQEIQNLTTQISGYQDEIDDLDTQIDTLNSSIEETQQKLDEATAEYEKQSDLLAQRLVTIYENGQTTYLDVLLSSKNLSDFISKYYLVTQLASYDTELLEGIEQKQNEINQAKQQLEEDKAQIEEAKSSKQAKYNQLQALKVEKDSQVSKLSDQEKDLQASLDQFEKDKREIQRELAKIQSNYGTPSAPSESGYIFPVLGLSKANIRNKTYPSYSGHTGVDININANGKTIVAVKDGTVVKSTAYKNSSGYYSYGECIIIDHHDGTATLYAHGAAGSRRVSKGQTVKQGQAIMTVGSTGNSTGPHLHFEVRINGKPVNPLPYLP